MSMKVSEILAAQLNETQPSRDKRVQEEFSFTLSKLDDDGLVERLSGLIDGITVQGKKLADHMDVNDMKKYRSMVSDFLNEVVTHSHKFSRENFLDRRGRHRVYSIIKLVNKDLDDLAQQLISNEKDHLKILEKVDGIRGLLLDILV